jgi:hypothetical protein
MARVHAWLADNGTIVDGAHEVGLQAFASNVVAGGVFVGLNVSREGEDDLIASFVTDIEDVEAFARALFAVADEAREVADRDNV